jgi:hypothetical protein
MVYLLDFMASLHDSMMPWRLWWKTKNGTGRTEQAAQERQDRICRT